MKRGAGSWKAAYEDLILAVISSYFHERRGLFGFRGWGEPLLDFPIQLLFIPRLVANINYFAICAIHFPSLDYNLEFVRWFWPIDIIVGLIVMLPPHLCRPKAVVFGHRYLFNLLCLCPRIQYSVSTQKWHSINFCWKKKLLGYGIFPKQDNIKNNTLIEHLTFKSACQQSLVVGNMNSIPIV